MLPCWSRSDGQENVGDQEFFDDQQDQQEFANQGNYSMGSTLMPTHHLLITHLHVSNFDTRKDILVIDYSVPCPHGLYAFGQFASAQHNCTCSTY